MTELAARPRSKKPAAPVLDFQERSNHTGECHLLNEGPPIGKEGNSPHSPRHPLGALSTSVSVNP